MKWTSDVADGLVYLRGCGGNSFGLLSSYLVLSCFHSELNLVSHSSMQDTDVDEEFLYVVFVFLKVLSKLTCGIGSVGSQRLLSCVLE